MQNLKAVAAFALLVSVSATPTRAQARPIDFEQTTFSAQTLGTGVTVLTGSPNTDPGHPEGAGGRIGILRGPDGVLMVDASYAPLAPKAFAAIRQLSSAQIRYLIDTHSHPDHTGGNPFFAKQGAMILARESVWQDLNQPPPPAVLAAIGPAASYTDPARLPNITYGPGAILKFGWMVRQLILSPGRQSIPGAIQWFDSKLLTYDDRRPLP